MNESVGNVDEEMELSQDSVKKAMEISMSATQQISGSKQIADSMQGIDMTMRQVQDGSTQVKEAADKLKGLANELNDSLKTIYKI